MLDEKDIKLIEKMISESIASVLNTNTSNETHDVTNDSLDSVWIPTENTLLNESIPRITAYEKRLGHRNGEKRKAKVIFAMSGGKASKGSQTTRITLPITWVREMGVSPDEREVNITFEDNKIIIEKSK